jgi:predicted N-formylglutamate amidohydrolase
LPGDSIDRHALRQGRLNILIEVRNDLIETAHDQDVWAALLAPLLKSALAEVQPHPHHKDDPNGRPIKTRT